MEGCSNDEYTDIHLFYGKADCSARLARQLYAEHFPDRRLPNVRTFCSIDRQLRERGEYRRTNRDAGRMGMIRVPEMEEEVLAIIARNPTMSTRVIARELGISHPVVWRILHENLLYPYHIQRVQALLPRDFEPRERFCRWVLEKMAEYPRFSSYILFTDEAKFSRDGITNYHNNHIVGNMKIQI